MKEDLNKSLHELFGNTSAKTKVLLEFLQKFYNIELFESYYEINDLDSFNYCKSKTLFALTIPYFFGQENIDTSLSILISRTFLHEKLEYDLIGGSINDMSGTGILEAVKTMFCTKTDGLTINELNPIALIKNTYQYSGLNHEVFGICFVGRVRKKLKSKNIISINLDKIQSIIQGSFNEKKKDIIIKAINRISTEKLDYIPEAEIHSNESANTKYVIHQIITKPILNILGTFYRGTQKVLDQNILQIINHIKPQSIIDVSCGDNSLITKLGFKPEKVVLNDISRNQVFKKISNSTTHDLKYYFTNHDVRSMPFRQGCFDLALCKNTIHHMNTSDSIIKLIAEVKKISKYSLFVEIIDPRQKEIIPKLINSYYRSFLEDNGNSFLNEPTLNKLFQGEDIIEKRVVKILKGSYYIILIKN